MTVVLENVMKMGGFDTLELQHGLLFDDSKGFYPSRLLGYVGSSIESSGKYGTEISTVFGVVNDGEVFLETDTKKWGPLNKGEYFSVVGEFTLSGKGSVAVFERLGATGIFQIGGPIEKRGRLTYIDGCSDSLLVYPPRLGDACMNTLWFPKNVRQTMHIHPTVRYALVISGTGRCVTPEGELPLKEGYIFRLDEMSQHCFNTDDSTMTIVTYHPDSDWGPTDENHPMKNRTLIGN